MSGLSPGDHAPKCSYCDDRGCSECVRYLGHAEPNMPTTPRPWEAVDCEVSTQAKPYLVICNTDTDAIDDAERKVGEGNAALIVAAVNVYDDVRALLWKLDALLTDLPDRLYDNRVSTMIGETRALLARMPEGV